MSREIDEKVVSLQFDNRHFEKNAQTSISTLDKLKQSLNLTGTSKGLEEVSAAAGKCNLAPLTKGVETVRLKFSAMEVMAVTALANITNSAVNAGKRIAHALTIQPVTTGFNEYELKMNAVQTIMASTGESVDVVNKYLNELNEYSDKTIYSFSDMTQNIGKFTNAGVKLEDAVLAMKGISNEAALAGANANEASRAMYNLSQAMSMGYVQYIDWKSIENANMATVGFKEQLIDMALQFGTVKKTGADTFTTLEGKTYNLMGMFKDGMKDQWLTTEVLINTLKDYADENTEIGKKATEAATKVKTLTQLWDTLKESAQSGWAQTWEIIIGDIEEAKSLFTTISDKVGGILGASADRRNSLLDGAMSSNWDLFNKRLNEAGINIELFQEKVAEVERENGISIDKIIEKYGSFGKAVEAGAFTDNVLLEAFDRMTGGILKVSGSTEELTKNFEELEYIAKRVIKGEFGNGEYRMKALADAGYDYATIQGLVNQLVEDGSINWDNLSDAQMENMGYTEEQIKKINELKDAASKSGKSIRELLSEMNRPSGRQLLIESFYNVLKPFGQVLKTIKEAWREVFPATTSEQLYTIIEKFNDFTKNLELTKDTLDKLKDTVKGFFSTMWFTSTITMQLIDQVVKIAATVLRAAGLDILTVTAKIGNAITKFVDSVRKNEGVVEFVKTFIGRIESLIFAVKEWIQALFETEEGQRILLEFKTHFSNLGKAILSIVQTITNAFNTFTSEINRLKEAGESISIDDFKEIGKMVIQGLLSGLGIGINGVIDAIIGIAKAIIDTFCLVLGIHSPSTVFMALGGFIIMGLISGILAGEISLNQTAKDMAGSLVDVFAKVFTEGFPLIWDAVKTIFTKLTEAIKNSKLDLGSLIVLGSLVATALFLKKLVGILEKLAKPVSAVSDVIDTLKDAISGLGSAMKNKLNSQAVLNIAIAIGILAASFFLLTKIEKENMWEAVAVLTAISIGMAGLMFAITKLNATTDAKEFGKATILLAGVAVTMLILAKALNMISSIEGNSWSALAQMGLMVGGLLAIMWTFAQITKVSLSGRYMDKLAVMFLGMAVAINIIARAMVIMSAFTPAQVSQSIGILWSIGAMITAFIAVSKLAGDNADKAGSMLFKIGIAIGILALALKVMASMTPEQVSQSMGILWGIAAMFGLFIAVSFLAGKHADKAGKMFSKFALALILLGAAIKLFATIKDADIKRGLHILLGVSAIFMILMVASELSGKNAGKAGLMFLGMAAAILAVSLCIKLLSGIGEAELTRATNSMLAVLIIFGLIVAASALAGEHTAKAGTMLLKMAGAILVISLAIALLSVLDKSAVENATNTILWLGSMFAILIVVSKEATSNVGAIWGLVAAIAVIAIAIAALSALDQDRVLNASIALSLVIGMVSLLALASGKMSQSIVPALTLAIIVGVLGGILYAVGTLPAEQSLAAAVALSLFIGAMTAVALVLGASGSIMPSAFAASILLAAIILVLGGAIIGLIKLATSALPGIGEDLAAFAENLLPFIDAIKQIDDSAIDGVEALADIIGTMAKAGFITWLTSLFGGDNALNTLAGELVTFAQNAAKYSTEISKVTSDAITKTEDVISMMNKMDEVDKGGIKKFKSALEELGEVSVSEFTKGFENATAEIETAIGNVMSDALEAISNKEDKFNKAGKEIDGWLSDGIDKKKSDVTDATENVAKSAAVKPKEKWIDFYNTGGYLVSGFASGISANTFAAQAAASAMASAALASARETLRVNSPSKEFRDLGYSVPEGFALGIDKMGRMVTISAEGMAVMALASVKKSISKLTDVIETDIDSQPTIRPVLDLTDIRSGVGAMNGMFDMNPSVGAMLNIRSINSMMNRNQNGGDSDIISAIKGLGRSLGNTSNNTYNINGVTYDDGTNVSDAVKALVRAARIERRV